MNIINVTPWTLALIALSTFIGWLIGSRRHVDPVMTLPLAAVYISRKRRDRDALDAWRAEQRRIV